MDDLDAKFTGDIKMGFLVNKEIKTEEGSSYTPAFPLWIFVSKTNQTKKVIKCNLLRIRDGPLLRIWYIFGQLNFS